MIPRILGALLSCLACTAQAGVYTYVDAEGNHVYTDQSPSRRKAQRVELAPGNSVAPPGIHYRPPTTPLEVKPPTCQLLCILFPEPDATLRANSGDVIVTVTSEPALLPGYRYHLLLDGKPAGTPGRGPVFPLRSLDHGIHQVTAKIIDGGDMTAENTPSQPFHLHRMSIAGQPLPEVGTPLVNVVQPSERQPNFPCPLRHGRDFPVFFPTLLTKAPPATPMHQIGAITRTTFYTVPISGYRSSPKTFPAHLQPAPRQKKRAFLAPDLLFAFSCPTLEQLPAIPTNAPHRLLLNNLTTAVTLPNGKLHLEYMNPAAEMLLAVGGQCSRGQFISELFTEPPEALNSLRRAVERAHPFIKHEATLTSITGVSITVDYVVTPILDRNKTLLLLEVHPCNRLVRITREEAQLSKQKATKLLVYEPAHRIKNPFGDIRGAAQLLSRELPEGSLKDYINVIVEGADRLRNLMDRILSSNKLPNLASINIHEVLEQVSSLVEAEGQSSITLVYDYSPGIPGLLLNRERMIQAVLNIIRNAMQTIARQNDLRLGRITLHSHTLRQFTISHARHCLVCKVEIIDSGSDISAEPQETVFYPMVSDRLDSAGFGLVITQNIISQHQELIGCESHPGHTMFSLLLPLEQGAH